MDTNLQQFNCPHCNQTLSIDKTTLAGNDNWELTCPACGGIFVIPNTNKESFTENKIPKLTKPTPKTQYQQQPAEQMPSPPPPQKGKFEWLIPSEYSANRYKWCRFYITASRIIAILVVIAAVIFIVADVCDKHRKYINERNNFTEQNTPSLITQQEKFTESYMRIAQRLLTANNINTGIKFPQDLIVIESSFNQELMTIEDVKESLNTMKEYEHKLTVIEQNMQNYFNAPVDRLYKKLQSGDAIKLSFGKKDSSFSLKLGEDANFYKDNPQDLLTKLFDSINILQRELQHKNISSADLEIIKSGLEFIEKQLNSKSTTKTYGSKGQRQSIVAGTDQHEYEKIALKRICAAILLLCSKDIKSSPYYIWLIAIEHNKLQTDLTNYSVGLLNIEQTYQSVLKETLKNAFWTIIGAIITAFMILVFADYLEAHLDTASTLRKILSRYPILFVFILPLLLAGCGESPADTLEKQKVELERMIINQIIAENIESAPHATAIAIPGKALYLISGGTPMHSQFSAPFEIVAFFREYNAVKLDIAAQAKFNKITPVKSKSSKHSHKTVMTVMLNYMSYGPTAKGIEVHGVAPEKTSQFNSWISSKIKQLPPETHDFAFVIKHLNTITPEKKSEVRPVSIVFDKKEKTWKLEKNIAMPEYIDLPEMPQDYQLNDFQTKHGFRKLEYREKQKNLYFSTNEWDDADKILNQKLVKFKGEWKPIIVVKQTIELSKYISSWEESCSITEWFNRVEKINQFPQAEELAKVKQYLETYFVEDFITPAKGTINGRNDLIARYNMLKKNPNITNLNNGNIIRLCAEAIIETDNTLKKKVNITLGNIDSINSMLSSNKNIFRCKDIINSDICLKHDKNLINHTQTLLTLYKLFTQNSSFADKSYQSHQNIGGHNVFGKCTVCLGSGIHPCKRCQNSKRCADCAGKGIQQHVSFDEARNPHYYDQQCFTCRGSAICTKCRGLNITCKGCKGSRKSINREEISKAITKEKDTISKLLLDIRNQIKEFSNSLNFVP